MIRPPRRSPPFPYTTLFRSADRAADGCLGYVAVKFDPVGAPRSGFSQEAGPRGADWVKFHGDVPDRKSTRLNSSHEWISYAVFCLKKKKKKTYTVSEVCTSH